MEVGWWRGSLFERSLCCTSCKTSHVFLRACISVLTAFTTSLKYSAYAAFPLEMSHSWTTRMSDWLKKSGLFFFFFFLRCFLSVLAASSFALICLAPPKRVCLLFFFHNFTWRRRTVFAAQCGSSLLRGEITAQIFVLQKSHGNALTFGLQARPLWRCVESGRDANTGWERASALCWQSLNLRNGTSLG